MEKSAFSSSARQQGGPRSVYPDLAKFYHYGKILKVFGKFFQPTLAKNDIGQIFFAVGVRPNIERIIKPSGHTGRHTVSHLLLGIVVFHGRAEIKFAASLKKAIKAADTFIHT